MYHRPAKSETEPISPQLATLSPPLHRPLPIENSQFVDSNPNIDLSSLHGTPTLPAPYHQSPPLPRSSSLRRVATRASDFKGPLLTSQPRLSSSRITLFIMMFLGVVVLSTIAFFSVSGVTGIGSEQGGVGQMGPVGSGPDLETYRAACPDYKHYSIIPHEGPMGLPFQRPSIHCRTFSSPLVEKIIEDFTTRMEDKDLARIFENAFPNTLDTTVRWHVDGSQKMKHQKYSKGHHDEGKWEGAQSFIVTGDINAEWLRDSTNQLAQYQVLAKKDKKIHNLILGAINTQAEFVIEAPYCNAFQPPPPSRLPRTSNGQEDNVHPAYEPSAVFECKYELDSLAHFLALTNQFNQNTGSTAFLNKRWYRALETLLEILDAQAEPTFDPVTGAYQRNEYTFQRKTDLGTETLSLAGVGNPLNGGTGLIRSAFRPSDDATILGYYIPANAMIAVELKRTAAILKGAGKFDLAKDLHALGENVEKAVWEHGVVDHKKYGKVFAYEVDGYGSVIIMDDANVPSLLALPIMGFVEASNPVYQNTRKMILDKATNPYYLKGKFFHGVGGPHIGLQNAWPMSLLLQAMTTNNDEEITEALKLVRNVSHLGLIHESINVNRPMEFTRSWFAWANSVFAQTILDLAARKPHLLFGKDAKPYIIE